VQSKGIFRALAAQEIRIKKLRDMPKRGDKTDHTRALFFSRLQKKTVAMPPSAIRLLPSALFQPLDFQAKLIRKFTIRPMRRNSLGVRILTVRWLPFHFAS